MLELKLQYVCHRDMLQHAKRPLKKEAFDMTGKCRG